MTTWVKMSSQTQIQYPPFMPSGDALSSNRIFAYVIEITLLITFVHEAEG